MGSSAKKKTKPKAKSAAGASFGNYKHLSAMDQVNGLRQRAAQLEAEHMTLVLRRLEVENEYEHDEDVTQEMLSETIKGIDKSIASAQRRLELINGLIAEYEEESTDE